jgi:hypothetical protein
MSNPPWMEPIISNFLNKENYKSKNYFHTHEFICSYLEDCPDDEFSFICNIFNYRNNKGRKLNPNPFEPLIKNMDHIEMPKETADNICSILNKTSFINKYKDQDVLSYITCTDNKREELYNNKCRDSVESSFHRVIKTFWCIKLDIIILYARFNNGLNDSMERAIDNYCKQVFEHILTKHPYVLGISIGHTAKNTSEETVNVINTSIHIGLPMDFRITRNKEQKIIAAGGGNITDISEIIDKIQTLPRDNTKNFDTVINKYKNIYDELINALEDKEILFNSKNIKEKEKCSICKKYSRVKQQNKNQKCKHCIEIIGLLAKAQNREKNKKDIASTRQTFDYNAKKGHKHLSDWLRGEFKNCKIYLTDNDRKRSDTLINMLYSD